MSERSAGVAKSAKGSATRWVVTGCAAWSAVFAIAPALGDTIYRYKLPDGSVVYADAPLSQGALQRVLKTTRRTPGELWARWADSEIHAYDARARYEFYAHERAMAYSRMRMTAAETALIRAERYRDAGAEPLPGERVGNVNGTSRLRPEYFARQRGLERALQDARLRMDRAVAEDSRSR